VRAIGRLARASVEEPDAEAFFERCLCELQELYGARIAFFGTFTSNALDRIRTRMVVEDGTRIENFEYELSGTPCEDVLDGEVELVCWMARSSSCPIA